MIPKLLLSAVELVDELLEQLEKPLGQHRGPREVTVDYDKHLGLLRELRRRLEEED